MIIACPGSGCLTLLESLDPDLTVEADPGSRIVSVALSALTTASREHIKQQHPELLMGARYADS